MRLEQFKFYNSVQNIYETPSEINQDSLYVVDGLCTIHLKNHGEFEKCDCAVKAQKLMAQKDYGTLCSGETTVSRNIAYKCGLKVGDYLFVMSSMFDSPKEYKIKEITDSCYGLKDIDYRNSTGLVVLGYDEKIAMDSNRCITFVGDIEKNDISYPQNTFVYSISLFKKNIIGFIISLAITYLAGNVFLISALFYINGKEFVFMIKSKKKYGEYNKNIFKEVLTATNPFYLLIFLLLLIGYLLYIRIRNLNILIIGLSLCALFGFAIFLAQLILYIRIRRI